MAQSVQLNSGSVLNGNPITFVIKPDTIIGKDADNNPKYPSFHRVVVEVNCGMSGGSFETIRMTKPVTVENGALMEIDISSALRTFRDGYEYSPQPTTYPVVKFNLKVYDEYMLDGVVSVSNIINNPSASQYYSTLFGAFSDLDRLKSGVSRSLLTLTRKPLQSAPQVVAAGETFVFTPAYTSGQTLEGSSSLTAPTSQVVTITEQGLQNIGGQSVYALPKKDAELRQKFRFINSFGVLESVSVVRVSSKVHTATSNSYTVVRQESFNRFSRRVVRKTDDQEKWTFSSGALTREWMSWYLHEFLMSEHIWMNVNGTWIPCTITPEEDTTFFDRTSHEMYQVLFTAIPDINGAVD